MVTAGSPGRGAEEASAPPGKRADLEAAPWLLPAALGAEASSAASSSRISVGMLRNSSVSTGRSSATSRLKASASGMEPGIAGPASARRAGSSPSSSTSRRPAAAVDTSCRRPPDLTSEAVTSASVNLARPRPWAAPGRDPNAAAVVSVRPWKKPRFGSRSWPAAAAAAAAAAAVAVGVVAPPGGAAAAAAVLPLLMLAPLERRWECACNWEIEPRELDIRLARRAATRSSSSAAPWKERNTGLDSPLASPTRSSSHRNTCERGGSRQGSKPRWVAAAQSAASGSRAATAQMAAARPTRRRAARSTTQTTSKRKRVAAGNGVGSRARSWWTHGRRRGRCRRGTRR